MRVHVHLLDGATHFVSLVNAESIEDVRKMLDSQQWWTVDEKTLIRTSNVVRVAVVDEAEVADIDDFRERTLRRPDE